MIGIYGETAHQRLVNALDNIEALDERIAISERTIRKEQADLAWAIEHREEYRKAAEQLSKEVLGV